MMNYCVIKDTTIIIDGSENPTEIMLKNALNAGYTETEVEILTEEEYQARKSLEPQPEPKQTLEEQLAEKDAQILKLKEEQHTTQQMTIQNSETQQGLIELLMDMGVI